MVSQPRSTRRRGARQEHEQPLYDNSEEEEDENDMGYGYVNVAESEGTDDSDRREYDSGQDSPGSLRDFLVETSEDDDDGSSEYVPDTQESEDEYEDTDTDSGSDSEPPIRPKVIFALPGQGKGSLLAMLNTRTMVVDADTILESAVDTLSGGSLANAGAYHLDRGGVERWYRACFGVLLAAQAESCLGPFLCTFVGRPGEPHPDTLSCLDLIIGHGTIEQDDGSSVSMIRPEEVVVLAPLETNTPPGSVATRCLQAYRALSARYAGRIRSVSSLQDLVSCLL